MNILASAAVSEYGLPRIVVRAGLRRQFDLVVSRHILRKLDHTLAKPYFATRLDERVRAEFVDLITKRSRQEPPDLSVRGIAPDLEGDLVPGTAVAANADYLVTGDKGLLAVRDYRGVRIVTADEFQLEMGRDR